MTDPAGVVARLGALRRAAECGEVDLSEVGSLMAAIRDHAAALAADHAAVVAAELATLEASVRSQLSQTADSLGRLTAGRQAVKGYGAAFRTSSRGHRLRRRV